MHPLFTRTVALGAYMLAWATLGNGLALALFLRQYASSAPGAIVSITPLAVIYGLACLAAWYVCRAFPLDRPGGLLRAALAHWTAAMLTSAVWVGFGLWWLRSTESQLAPSSPDGVVAWFVAGVLLFLMSSAFHTVYLAVEASQEARRQALESAVLAREAELRALRAQVNPHFLFNSLHSIAALAPNRPADARRMAIGLGEFLRQSLRLGSRTAVTLADEVALASEYLAIESVRFGDRLTVVVDVPPEAAVCALPPLLLQPLVENAIKHGVAGLLDGGTVTLTARVTGSTCEVTVRNAYDDDSPVSPGTGTGLANVRARLRAHFGGLATLEARGHSGAFVARLVVPKATVAGTQGAEVSA
jgi:two-component system, LytTR family, sensor histidine kinase AlgZ